MCPAWSDARDWCASRSQVHMQMVNSAVMLDRGNGMGLLRACRVVVDGKHRASNANRRAHLLVAFRQLIVVLAALVAVTLSGSASYAQSGPFAGMAGNWSG